MRKAGKYLAAMLAVVMCMGLAACGKDFDAAGYTKSVLDANYHGEYADYAKFRNLSKEKAKAEIEDGMDTQVESAFEGQSVSDEAKAKYKAAVLEIMKLSKYEVKEAKKQKDDSFVVTVEIEPVNAFSIANDAMEEISEKYQKDGKDLKDTNVIIDVLAEALNKGAKENTYGEKVSLDIHVTQDGDNAYGIEALEVTNLESAMFPGM